MIFSFVAAGFAGQLITVECSIRKGIPGTDIVGLPDGAVKEARERVRAVLVQSGYTYPSQRILINLAPAGLKKTGASFDLPIALSILLVSEQLPVRFEDLPHLLVLGELELSGRVRGIEGALSAVASGLERQIGYFLVPGENLKEAESLQKGAVYPLCQIAELPRRLREIADGSPFEWFAEREEESVRFSALATVENSSPKEEPPLDFSMIKGQPLLKRALEIAIAGRHNLLIFGPPGCGKTMAVHSARSLLPVLSPEEMVEKTRIWSQAGLLEEGEDFFRYPPMRMPHHSATLEGLIGGGSKVRPGEVSLAHNGVLFLDEAPEFKSSHLQGLREPLENHRVVIVRAGKAYWYPADFQLIMAVNPCPCGNLGREESVCTCSQNEISRYWKRVGGALLDRIDMRVPVSPVPVEILLDAQEESSAKVRDRILKARERQGERFQTGGKCVYNGRITAGNILESCALSQQAKSFFTLAVKKLGLSSRACHSVLRIARTIADLRREDLIDSDALLEAIEYRRYGDRDIFWTSF